MQPYPRAQGHVWLGHLHGAACLSAQAMDSGLSYCCVALVFASGIQGNSATPGWGLQCVYPNTGSWLPPANPSWGLWCFCLSMGFAFTPPILAWVLGCVSSCAHYARTPQILVGLCGVGVFVWVLSVGFTLPILAGLLGCVCLCSFPPVPRHSWLGCAPCDFECGFWPRPTISGSGLWRVCLGWDCPFIPPILAGVFGRACLCVRSACTLPILVGVWGACVPVQVLASPRQSLLAVVVARLQSCVVFRSQILAGVLGCVCWFARSACTPLVLAGAFRCGSVCLGFAFQPANPGWAVGM